MDLFHAILDLMALRRALHRAARGKRSSPEVAWFLFQRDARLLKLKHALAAETWRPGPYQLLNIREPKPRVIAVSPFADRVVHHAVTAVIEPLLSRSYIDQSYACLPGRGTHRAVLALQGHLRQHRFLMSLDIRKYFPSLPHDRLLERLARRIRDAKVLRLCARMLEADRGLYLRPKVLEHLGDVRFEPGLERGVAVGSLMSQLYGNFYLDGLDHFIKRTLKVRGYQRYLDNMSLFGSSRGELRRWRREIVTFVEQELGLQLSTRHEEIRPTSSRVDYLGYEVTRVSHVLGEAALWRFEARMRRLARGGTPGRQDLVRLGRSWQSMRGMLLF